MKEHNYAQARKRQKKIKYIYQQETKFDLILKNKKYFIKTYGCQMNVHDSELIASQLDNLGGIKTSDYTMANIIVLNTCAVRENAHNKVFGFLGRIKHLKRDNPNLLVIFCGCMAQEEIVTKQIKEKLTFVDIVIGTHNIHQLAEKIESKKKQQDIEVMSASEEIIENVQYKRDSKIKAWVNIMFGCDKFCTYCIVPYTRGKQRSRKHEDILQEIQELVRLGYQEVTLLGQNVNAYGKDNETEINFASLLEMIAKTNIPRIRFMTSHPWDFSDELITTIKNNNNIMPYLHLPMQSGSSKVLKLMGRRYTKEEYVSLFKKIKTEIPYISITTDIIVGFPNETEENFQETLETVKECAFDGAFTFIYSKREGTPAAKINDLISLTEKEKRLQELNDLINYYALLSNQKLINTEVLVLVEGQSQKNKNKLTGYTEGQKLVNFDGDASLIGQIVKIKITAANSFSLKGEII